MQHELNPLSKTKPLADPVRVIAILMVVSGIILGLVYVNSAISALGVWAVLAGLGRAFVAFSVAILIGPGGRPNAIYLRAFKTDGATAKLRAQLSAILGPDYRLSGIRPPGKRSSVFLRFLLPGLTAFRYAGSKFMDLEAGDDWMARLWKTHQTARLVFIDVRETTQQVSHEIRMTLETVGVERCVFVVGPHQTTDAWRQEISQIAGPDFNATNFYLLDASDLQMEGHLAGIVRRLPAGVPGDTERGQQFVLDHVSPRDLAKSHRVSTGAAVSVFAALALSAGLGLLPRLIELILLLPVIVVTLVLMVRGYVLGTRRVRLLSQFRHRGAAGRASAMLAMAFLLYFGGIALIAMQAVPALTKLRTAANELSAINSLRVIDIAQLQYQATYPDRGFACQLSQLGGDPAAGAPSADAAQMISPDLAAGMRAGYRFTLSCPRATAGERAAATAFLATGVPYASGKGRNRGFCTNESGVITVDPNGGTDCKEPLK